MRTRTAKTVAHLTCFVQITCVVLVLVYRIRISFKLQQRERRISVELEQISPL